MKSILVPIDCSNATPRVLGLARQMARALSAEIHLVHVREMLPAMPPGVVGYGVAGMAELMPMSSNPIPVLDPMPQPAPVNESDKTKLNEWQKQIVQDGVKATLSEPTGPIVEEILREADAINADLIVMGRHGHGAMYNLLVGSVTEGVLKRSARPVLLVPSPKS
jgi:nucleotide-binding universal stress UspA family protein